MLTRRIRPYRLLVLPLLFVAAAAQAQGRITSPQEQFGKNIGDDYWLANYDQLAAYWQKLDGESDRMKLVEIGKTAEGRPQYMAIVTSPQNHARLDHYKSISQRLAKAEGLTDEQARALAREGKAVVWIDGGLHSTEVLGAHQLMETLYQFLSRNDDETLRILNDVIILFVHANPDGMQLVNNWYMKDADTLRRATNIPRLYQKYIGHDNNRDFYMASQPESQNMNKAMYWEWFPQIMYNHHQTGPAGTVMFAPPFRDPFNYNYDPLIVSGLDMVGASMHDRFIQEGKPGVTMRSGAGYSTWWNGGLRTTAYFKNIIGLLTETIGHPTPMRIPFIPERQLPRGDLPYPIEPQEWKFRQSVDYSVTANYAVLDIASRRKDVFLYNIYRMGRNSIERGSRDTWSPSPTAIARAREAANQGGPQLAGGRGGGAGAASQRVFEEHLRNPANRDPRGYIIPSSQPDFPTATKFINALRYNGVTVHRATRDFTVAGKTYPAGSYVVKTAQAFRPHVIDMFEPQDHPNDFAYPGGPPIRPYDNAGWTLAYQMGIQFDRIMDGFDGPFEAIDGLASPMPGRVNNAQGAAGFLFSNQANDAFLVINRLQKARVDVHRTASPMTAGGRTYPAGSFYAAGGSATLPILQTAATDLGLTFDGTNARVGNDATRLQARRIALWDQYGGSMPSGWTRFILERFEFPFEVVYPQQLDAGNLRSKYDVIVFVTGAVPGVGGGGGGGRGGGGGQTAQNIPREFQHMLGTVSIDRTVPQLKQFLEAGGTVLTIGSSTALAYHLGLPISDHLVERSPDGTEQRLPGDKFFIPGSVLRVSVDNTAPAALGMPSEADVFFNNSPVFRLAPDAHLKGVRPVAWFSTTTPLRSGWAWGQNYLEGGVAVAEAQVGRGRLYLYGPEVLFRSQPHGTYKLFFNGLVN